MWEFVFIIIVGFVILGTAAMVIAVNNFSHGKTGSEEYAIPHLTQKGTD